MLVAELRADQPDVRTAAARALGMRTDTETIEPLVAALSDGEVAVRTAAAQAVARFGVDALGPLLAARERAAGDVGAHDEALEAIAKEMSNDGLLQALTSPDRAVRTYARESGNWDRFISSLGWAGTEEDPRAIEALIELARAEGSPTRLRAIGALAKRKAAEAFNRLAELLATDQDPDVRGEAAVALGVLGDARAVEPLVKALARAKEQPAVREKTVAALQALADERALPALQPLLTDEGLRRPAARALGALGAVALPALLEALDDSRTDSYELDRAIAGMGAAAVGPLIERVEQPERGGGHSAVRILGHIDDPRAVSLLIAMVGRADPAEIRRAAAALANQRAPKAAEVLVAAFDAGNHVVIAAAHPFFVRQGTAGSEARILAALEREGDRDMAETLLNCGNKELTDGATAWALRHGFRVQTWSIRGGGTRWGER
jgi:HEAT repeat protein